MRTLSMVELIANVSKNVHQANADSIDLQRNMGKIFHQVFEGGAELATVQTQQSDHAREMAIELQGSLQNMREQEIGAMLALFHGIHNQLVRTLASMSCPTATDSD